MLLCREGFGARLYSSLSSEMFSHIILTSLSFCHFIPHRVFYFTYYDIDLLYLHGFERNYPGSRLAVIVDHLAPPLLLGGKVPFLSEYASPPRHTQTFTKQVFLNTFKDHSKFSLLS